MHPQTLNECQEHLKTAQSIAQLDQKIDKDTWMFIRNTQEKRRRQEIMNKSKVSAWNYAKQWVYDKKEAFVTMQVQKRKKT